jgi:sterol 24-C-methyltransferase
MTIAEPLPTPNQDPTADGFIMRLRKKNTDSKSHKATVDSYFSYWDVDRNSLEDTSSGIKKRRGGSDKLTNHFYDLVTDFYEYGTIFFFDGMIFFLCFSACFSNHRQGPCL